MTDLAEFVEIMQQEFDAFVAEKKSEIRAAAVQAMAEQRKEGA